MAPDRAHRRPVGRLLGASGAILFAAAGLLADPPAPLRIVDRPIPFDAERLRLSREYLAKRYGIENEDARIEPRMVIVHYTAIDSFEASWRTFARTRVNPSRRIAAADPLNVSTHYLVDRDGTIYRLMPEDRMARHSIGLNYHAIGIENVGGDRLPLTDAQLSANAALIRDIVRRRPEVRYVIGHMEYRRFEGSPLFLERDPRYRNQKPDPGADFMVRLRALLVDLALRDRP